MWSLIEKYTSYHVSEKQKSSNNMKHGAVSCVDSQPMLLQPWRTLNMWNRECGY